MASDKRPATEKLKSGTPSGETAAKGGQRADIPVVPTWNKAKRELWFGDTLVKRFRRPAPIAELIFDAFELEHWNERIDDPLPPRRGRNEADRLRHQIDSLNRRLDRPTIHFSLDGTGTGIRWAPAAKECKPPGKRQGDRRS